MVTCTLVTRVLASLPHALHPSSAMQVSEFLFGSGFAIAGGDLWRVRRKAVGPALHRAYLQTMIARVFGPSAEQLCAKLEVRLPLANIMK